MTFPRGAVLAGVVVLWLGGIAPAWGFAINEWRELEIQGAQRVNGAPPVASQPWTETVSGMDFVWIPGGCFNRGSAPDVTDRETDEGPIRQACVSHFWMGRTEVTQGQWRRVMRSNPSHHRKGDDYPVEGVAWDDIEGFQTRLARLYPQWAFEFRLPTEAEWEFACRDGGLGFRFAGGNDVGALGWHGENSDGYAHPVGSRRANSLGLSDLSGNVWEWVEDVYRADGYATAPERDPRRQDPLGVFRVVRGGSYTSSSDRLRCANRGFAHYGEKRADLGFRLVLVPRAPQPPKPATELQDLPF
ncbi:MAG: formylglycine-generating enzyme family protein [Magnetococcus sp. WYHC-3]